MSFQAAISFADVVEEPTHYLEFCLTVSSGIQKESVGDVKLLHANASNTMWFSGITFK